MESVPTPRSHLKNPKAFELEELIENSPLVEVEPLLSALHEGEITTDEYITLSTALIKKNNLIEGHFSENSKHLTAEVERLGVDPVTGLFTRNNLEKTTNEFLEELNHKERENRNPTIHSIVVFALDLDNLRKWNEFGHQFGDQALQTIAKVARAELRNSCAFRLGDRSDEIVVLVKVFNPLTDEVIKERIVERFKTELNGSFIEVKKKGGEVVKEPVTAATGFVVLRPGEQRSLNDILHEADQNQLLDKGEAKEIRIREAREKLGQVA